MTYTGHMQDGVVVFDGPAPPDGAAVRVEPAANGPAPSTGGADLPPIINPLTGRPYPSYIPRELAERMRRLANGDEQPPPGPSLFDRLKPVIDAAGELDLPTDGALNHDHYLYGRPKKS